MRRFLHAWGPPLIGGVIMTASLMGVVACGLGEHWIKLVPCAVAMGVSMIASIVDLEGCGPVRRRDKLPCADCRAAGLALTAVTKDRDELREALATLRIEAAPEEKRRP